MSYVAMEEAQIPESAATTSARSNCTTPDNQDYTDFPLSIRESIAIESICGCGQ